MYVKWWYFKTFFSHFLKIFFGGLLKRYNGKKWHPSSTISQELYIIWSQFLVNLCKITIYAGAFLIFKKILISWAVRGVKSKKWPKMRNNSYNCHTPYLRNRTSSEHNFSTRMQNDDISRNFFLFFQKKFLGELSPGEKRKILPKLKNNYIWYATYLRKGTTSGHNSWYTDVKWWYIQVFFCFFFSFSKNFDYSGC